MNEEFKSIMQKKFDDLMERIAEEKADNHDGFFDYLENAELVLVGTTFYDMSKDEWEITLDSYSASKGYTEFVKYAGTNEEVTDCIQSGLVKALDTSVVFCDEQGNYYM